MTADPAALLRFVDDAEIEEIAEQAVEAAIHAPHIAIVVNPYAGDRERSEIWAAAFRQAYATENEK